MEYNIYDLHEFDPKTYSYCKESLPYIRRRKWCRAISMVLLIAGGVYTICLTIHSNMLFLPLMLFLLYCFWVMFLQALLFSGVSKKLRKKNHPQAAHDYNYDFYVHIKTKKKEMYLLAMAGNQLRLNRFDLALQALQLIDRNKLNKDQLWQYYLLNAAAAMESGQMEKVKKYIEFCNMAGSGKTTLSVQMTAEELLDAQNLEEQQKLAVSLTKKFLFVLSYLVLSVFYVTLEASLSAGVEYRQWFSYAGYSFIWMVGIGIGFWLLMKGCKYFWKIYQSEAQKVLMTVLCVILAICIAVLTLFAYIGKIVSVDEETDNGDGTVTVRNYGGQSSLYEKKGLFFREYISDADQETDQSDGAVSDIGDSTTAEPAQDQEPVPDTGNISQNAEALTEAYQAVYEATGNKLEYELQYSAKGVLYLCTQEQQTDEGTVRWRIVYDRESENGDCSEFVYYRDMFRDTERSIIDTEILNFYAYVHETKEVIAANKTNWGGGGDQAYRDATGE